MLRYSGDSLSIGTYFSAFPGWLCYHLKSITKCLRKNRNFKLFLVVKRNGVFIKPFHVLKLWSWDSNDNLLAVLGCLYLISFDILNTMLCFCLPCRFYLCKIPAVILIFVPTNALSSRLVLKMFSFSSCLCFSRKCPLLTLCFFPVPVPLKFFFFFLDR